MATPTETRSMKNSRRTFMSVAAVAASAAAAGAHAQFGGRQRGQGGSMRSSRSGDANPRAAAQALADPVVAIERELPSLRIDLKLSAEQAVLFDAFERDVRAAAEAGRLRSLHLSSFRGDDGSSVKADAVLGTIADDDRQRADASRQAVERMTALYAALTDDQRQAFDRRVIQSLREPLGTS
jgi:hypothetical protein